MKNYHKPSCRVSNRKVEGYSIHTYKSYTPYIFQNIMKLQKHEKAAHLLTAGQILV